LGPSTGFIKGARQLSWVSDQAEISRKDREIIAKQADKIEGLEADLESAVRVAYKRGAKEWTKKNYPNLFKRWDSLKEADPK
jgi:hypothetical protein